MPESFLDFLNETKKEEGIGGGNGFIGQIKVEFGYKIYVAGMSNEESWFPYKARDEKSKNEAHDSALNTYIGAGLSEEEATKKLRQSSCAIILKNGTVLNRTTNWQGDQYFVYALWTKAFQEVLEPSMSGKISSVDQLGKWLWGWIKFMPDPSGRTRTYVTRKDDGTEKSEERAQMVAYLEEIFATKVAAVARAAEIGGASADDESDEETTAGDNLEVPEGFTSEEWRLAVSDIKKAHASGKSAFALSKDYGVEIRFIKAAIG